MAQLGLEQGSHLFMSVQGWEYPMDANTVFTAGLMVTVKNMLRSEEDEPFDIRWPWPQEPTASSVTDEERAVLTAQLQSKSAFAQIRAKE